MRSNPDVDFAVELTDEQIEQFHRDGFLQIPKITTDVELDWIREVFDDLFDRRAGLEDRSFHDLGASKDNDGPEVLPQLNGPDRWVPDLLETAFVRNGKHIATQLLDCGLGDLGGFTDMILKPAGYGRETPWHQDEAYAAPEYQYRWVSLWTPLEDASIESGCMWFMPGTHKQSIRQHRHIDDDPNTWGLEALEYDPADGVACPVLRGGATLHDARTMHYAGPNTTDRPRRAYINRCMAPTKPAAVVEDRPWQTAT